MDRTNLFPAPRGTPIRAPAPAPRRFRPRHGEQLTLAAIRGQWWPSGHVECAGIFCVCWLTPAGATYWAALHDFTEAAQRALIATCRAADQDARSFGTEAA